MTSTLAAEAYENLMLEFREEEGVTVQDGHLMVRHRGFATAFAFLKGDELAVWLPAARIDDLISRGFAHHFTVNGHASEGIALVSDQSLWSELTREAHEHMGEPPIGGQS
jgi:hypothetical protein